VLCLYEVCLERWSPDGSLTRWETPPYYNAHRLQPFSLRKKRQVIGMSGGWNSTGMSCGKSGNIGCIGGNQSDFECSRVGRRRKSLSLLGGIVKIGCLYFLYTRNLPQQKYMTLEPHLRRHWLLRDESEFLDLEALVLGGRCHSRPSVTACRVEFIRPVTNKIWGDRSRPAFNGIRSLVKSVPGYDRNLPGCIAGSATAQPPSLLLSIILPVKYN